MSIMSTTLPVVWTILHSYLHGYHQASLNGIQDVLTCSPSADSSTRAGLRGCIDITVSLSLIHQGRELWADVEVSQNTQFGVVTTILTIGGLLGALGADRLTNAFGRVGALRVAELSFILGAILVGTANGLAMMIVGRIIIGLGSGLTMVTVPLRLVELSNHGRARMVGTLHQIAIGLGMISTIALSIPFAKGVMWRFILVIGLGLGVVLLLGGLVIGRGGKEAGARKDDDGGEEGRPLLAGRDEEKPMGVKDLLTSKDLSIRRGLIVVIVAHMSAQGVGISPVMYFSTHILSPVFPASSKLIALGIMAIGIPFNFLPGLLPTSFGTKRLLMLSAMGTTISSALLILGLNQHHQALSIIGIISFVLSFSIGLAPLPWVVLSEVMPAQARTATGSIAVCLNWSTNFAVGTVFLPVQTALKDKSPGGGGGEGNVFYMFVATGLLAVFGIWGSYRRYDQVRE